MISMYDITLVLDNKGGGGEGGVESIPMGKGQDVKGCGQGDHLQQVQKQHRSLQIGLHEQLEEIP